MTRNAVLEQIVSEWEQWWASRPGQRDRAGWATRHRSLRGWTRDRLRDPRISGETDAMQAALVAEAQLGCHGATLTLIVQFRPALATMARAIAQRPGSTAEDAATEVVGTFTEVVLGHNLDRRPGRIAGNLVGDTRQRLSRAGPKVQAQERSADGWPSRATVCEPSVEDDGPEHLDLLAAVRDSLGALSGSAASRALTRELAFRSWFLGESNATIAADLHLAPELVRTRLCRLRGAVRRRHQSAVMAA